MKHANFFNALLATIALFAGGAAFADTMMGRYEWDVETDTSTTTLPERVPATFFARSCAACSSVELRLSAESKFFLGKESVSLDVLRESIKKQRHFMMVFYKWDSREVTRIVVHAGAPATAAR